VDDFFVCLVGAIRIETADSEPPLELQPGERAEIKRPRVHRVVNVSGEKSEYLLVQGVGTYDFIKDIV
jgi:hypothetical protein